MRETIFLYPGQGSQFTGMAADLFERSAKVRELFADASDVCGRDMRALLFEASEDELKETENAQPAVVLASLAAWAVMADAGFESTGAAGHSLGEYAALVDAGVLSAADALKAVSARGSLMASAGEKIRAEKGDIGMAAVLGIGPEAVRAVLEGHRDVWSANENGAAQVAVGGTKAAMEAAADDLKAAGARRIIPLKVSCPFHTPLMAGSAEAMRGVLDDMHFADPRKRVWSNVSAAPVVSGDEARELLIEQVTHPVRWVDLTASIAELTSGSSEGGDSGPVLYETGPGSVLTGLWAKSGLKGRCSRAGTSKDIDKIIEPTE